MFRKTIDYHVEWFPNQGLSHCLSEALGRGERHSPLLSRCSSKGIWQLQISDGNVRKLHGDNVLQNLEHLWSEVRPDGKGFRQINLSPTHPKEVGEALDILLPDGRLV